MNIPNRKNVNTRSAPGKRHFESTNPFSDPRTVEMIVAGIASLKLFARLGERSFQAVCHAATVQTCGSVHAWLTSGSTGRGAGGTADAVLMFAAPIERCR